MYKQFLFNIFGQFLQVHFLICIHSQTLLSQILMKILQDIPVYMYIRGFRNRGFRLLTNFDNFIVFQMSIFKTYRCQKIFYFEIIFLFIFQLHPYNHYAETYWWRETPYCCVGRVPASLLSCPYGYFGLLEATILASCLQWQLIQL